jgi:MFS family permease
MALLFYMLSSFYLTFSIYLQSGLHLTPLEAGWRTVPFGIGYLLASFASAAIMQRLGPRALTLGFVVQIVGFGLIAAVVAGTIPIALAIGLVIAGAGFGIVMPSVLKAILGGVNARHAGLASGVVISTFQIGAALGVATVTGVFYWVLGIATDPASHARAFAIALSCNIGLIFVAALLSLRLGDPDPTAPCP